MKQFLTAGIIALGIHGLLLCLDFNWRESLSFERPKSRVLNMSLTSVPIKTPPRPDFQQPKPVLREPPVVKKKIAQPERKRIVKPLPQKKDRIPLQTNYKDLTEKIPEQSFDTTESGSEPEKKSTKVLSKKTEQNALTPSPMNVIHEARPIYRSNPPPKYPRIARIRGYQGDVLLDVLVNTDGKVDDLKIYKSSSHPLLDRAAASSVKHWVFEPGMIGKKKVNMWVRVPIRFELKE